jgi:hypothetical protein
MKKNGTATGQPSWKGLRLGRIDLEEVVYDTAEKWGLPADSVHCSATPHRIDLKVGDSKISRLNWDIGWRFLMWLSLVSILPASNFAENLGVFPHLAGVPVGAGLMSAFGLLSYMQLKSNFQSRVIKQLDDIARARAVTFEELLIASVLALWAIIHRPLFSGVKNYLVWWGNLENNFDKAVGEPILEAIVGLYSLDRATEKNPQGGWTSRNYYDQKMQSALANAKELESLWFRTVAIPHFLHCFVLGASVFAFVVIAGLPLIQPFLDAFGRR